MGNPALIEVNNMINTMKSIVPEIYWYNVPEEIKVESIFSNLEENNNTEIKYKDTCPHGFTPNSMPYVGYIFIQALTKVLDKSITIIQTPVSTPTHIDTIERMRKYDTKYAIKIIYIARSAFTKSNFYNWRETKAPVNKELDNMLTGLPGYLLGVTPCENELYFFIDKQQYTAASMEYILLTLTYRFLVKDRSTHPEVHHLFRTLGTLLSNYKVHMSHQQYFNEISLAYIEYLDTCDEYKIDRTKRLGNLIRSLKEQKLERFKRDLEAKRSNMNAKFEQLEEASRQFKEANFVYQSLLSNNIETILVSIKDVTDLLERSKAIIDYSIIDCGLKITTRTKLEVNSKEDFEDILKHKTQNTITRLLREALIEEKYNIYTYASIKMDFTRERIERTDYTSYDIELNALPNPHIMAYSCFGQYTQVIAQLLIQNKFMEAVEEAIEATSGLNWADGPVVNRLWNDMEFYTTIQYIETPEKELITFREYERRINEAIPSETQTTVTLNIPTSETEDGPIDTTVIG